MKQLWTSDIAYQMGQLDYNPVNQGLTQCRVLDVYKAFVHGLVFNVGHFANP